MRRFTAYSLLFGSLLLFCGCSCDGPPPPKTIDVETLGRFRVATLQANEIEVHQVETKDGTIYIVREGYHDMISVVLAPKKDGGK